MADSNQRYLYHITHVDNLPSIIASGGLWSDRRVAEQQPDRIEIGYGHIKQRRQTNLVACHPGTCVGDYVPFYFCPRSVMLYVIHRGNPNLDYKGGQEEIVHLVSRVGAAIAAAGDRPWAFTNGSAATEYAQFSNDLEMLESDIDWNAVNATYWSDPVVKERKQAEFLVHDWFPWTAFVGIGAMRQSIAEKVIQMITTSKHQLRVVVKRSWYY